MPRTKRRVQPYLVLSTVGSRSEAETISHALIKEKVAACVNIVANVQSLFRWKKGIDQAKELLLIVKTDAHHLSRVERTIRKHHAYEVPEMVGWPITWGHQPYLDWLSDSILKS